MKKYKSIFEEDGRNIIPNTFDKWVKKEFKSLKGMIEDYGQMYFGEAYPWIEEEIDEDDYDTEEEYEEALEQAQLNEFRQENENRFYNWINQYKSMKFPMTVYRVIGLKAKNIDDIANIDLNKKWKKGVGIYWTDGQGDLEAYWSEGGKDFTIRAIIKEKDVNWKDMLYNNMNPSLGEEESEIQLELNTKILLTGIAEGKSINDKDFTNLNFMVKT